MLSYPETQTVIIHAPCGDNGREDFGDLGVWVSLLSHVMESCPELQLLDVVLEPMIAETDFDKMGEFMRHVFPQLPRESKASVNIVFGKRLKRGHFQVSCVVSWL